MDVGIPPISKRDKPPTIKANKAGSTRKLVAHISRTHVASISKKSQRGKYKETCRGNVDYRIPGLPQSTVQKEDSNRKEISKNWLNSSRITLPGLVDRGIEQDWGIQSVQRKSKELITCKGNTEYFELCETSSEIQCPDCALYWEAGIIFCTCAKCMQPTERNRQLNKARYDVLSIPGYVIKKNPTHGARHGPSMRSACTTKHMICCGKPASRKVVVTKPFWKDGTMMTNTASLCQILGGLENRSFNIMQSHCKIIFTWLPGKKEVGTRKPGHFLWMQKVLKGYWISAVTS